MVVYLDRPVFDYTCTKYKGTKDSRKREVHAYRIAQRIGGRKVASVSAFLTLIGMGRELPSVPRTSANTRAKYSHTLTILRLLSLFYFFNAQTSCSRHKICPLAAKAQST